MTIHQCAITQAQRQVASSMSKERATQHNKIEISSRKCRNSQLKIATLIVWSERSPVIMLSDLPRCNKKEAIANKMYPSLGAICSEPRPHREKMLAISIQLVSLETRGVKGPKLVGFLQVQ